MWIYYIVDKNQTETVVTGTVVFSNVFAFCLRGILFVRIRNALEYQKIWKSYIVSGVVVLLWSIYALYSSGYSFLVILLLCVIIPGILAYCFKGRLMDIQTVYLAYSGYNALLFFLIFAFQSFFAFPLPQFPAFCWLTYSLGTAEKFLKQGNKQALMDWGSSYATDQLRILISASIVFAGMCAAMITRDFTSFFDSRFIFYVIIVCSLVEDLEFRLYTKMWDQLMKRKTGPSGRVIG